MLVIDDNNTCPKCGAYYAGTSYCANGHYINRKDIDRNRVSFLMKTPIEELVKSKKYKKMLKDSEKEMGRSWWYFHNIKPSAYTYKDKPWLWQFKEGEDSE